MTRVLMPVFNEIDHDGRVERCARSVGKDHEVLVLALDSGKPYASRGFQTKRVTLPAVGPLRPFLFWAVLLWTALILRPRIIHAHDYFLAFPGWLAARLTGAKTIYDAHELIIPVPGEKRRIAMIVFGFLERLVIGRGDGIIAANKARADIMVREYGLKTDPTIIENIPDPEPDHGSDYPVPPKAPGTFRLVYQGFLTAEYGLDAYIRAVAAARSDGGPDVDMVFAGPGPDATRLGQLAQELCPGRAHFLGRVPRQSLPAILRTGDAGIIVYGRATLNEIHCAPNKVHEYARAGLPMLANGNPGLISIVSGNGIGVADDDATAGLIALRAGYARFKAALPAFLAAHDWTTQETRLAELYGRLR